jgi:4-fold beta flower protein
VFFVTLLTPLAAAQDEITLFDGQADATAYIAVDDDSTIYLWSGTPVAYLDDDPRGGFHVYGFNGKHLGWLVRGIVWDHQGHVACATKERLRSPKFEPFKAFKQFKPFKAFREFSPLRPIFSESWSDTSCQLLLARGSV